MLVHIFSSASLGIVWNPSNLSQLKKERWSRGWEDPGRGRRERDEAQLQRNKKVGRRREQPVCTFLPSPHPFLPTLSHFISHAQSFLSHFSRSSLPALLPPCRPLSLSSNPPPPPASPSFLAAPPPASLRPLRDGVEPGVVLAEAPRPVRSCRSRQGRQTGLSLYNSGHCGERGNGRPASRRRGPEGRTAERRHLAAADDAK